MGAAHENAGRHLVVPGDLDSLLLPLMSLPDSFNIKLFIRRPPCAKH